MIRNRLPCGVSDFGVALLEYQHKQNEDDQHANNGSGAAVFGKR